MDVASFADIEQDFNKRVSTIVWCLMTTVDSKGRPRSRVIHPVWEGATGYCLTGPESFKAKQLAKNPNASFGYWSVEHGLVIADCVTSWEPGSAEKQRIWDLFKNTPAPYGYDPSMFFQGGAADHGFGVLTLKPWRIELHGLQELMAGTPPRVWRQAV